MANSLLRTVIIDRLPLVRLGLARVLETERADVVAEFSEAKTAIAGSASTPIELLIFGSVRDRALIPSLREFLKRKPRPSVIVLLTNIEREEVGELVKLGVDAILTRGVAGEEFADALRRVRSGERVFASAVLPFMMGSASVSDEGEPGDELGAKLTAKEIQVLSHLAAGLNNAQIAQQMFVTKATVKTHLAHIYRKLGVNSRHEALSRALSLGLLS